MRKVICNSLQISPQLSTLFFRLFICILIFLNMPPTKAQQVVQIKTFTEDLKPLGNLKLSINQGKYISIPASGITFENLSESQFPVKSINLLERSLEAASWNFSEGILEVTIRKKSYIDTPLVVLDFTLKPIAGLTIVFNGQKTVSKSTNEKGIINLPLGLNEKVEGIEQFKISNYQILSLSKEPMLQLKVKKEFTPIKNVIASLDHNKVEKKDLDLYVTEKLQLIQDLEQFYSFLKEVPMDELSQGSKSLIDAKFESLLDGFNGTDQADSLIDLNYTSDSDEENIDNLLQQAKIGKGRISKQLLEFEEKIQSIRNKLNVGIENLTKNDKEGIASDIKLLENILMTNKNEFFDNQSTYQTIINELKRRFFDLQELDLKLTESELQRVSERKKYQKQILAILAVVLVFTILIILLFLLRTRLKNQKMELIKANQVVQSVNENLETIVSERTHLLEETFKELDLVLYRASHDLRAPICSIAGLSDLLARDTGNSELTDLVLKTNEQMDKLLKKLSTISEIHQPGTFKSVEVKSLIQNQISRFSTVLDQSNIELNFICQEDIEIKSIPFLIEVAFYNLLENSINFCQIKPSQNHVITVQLFIENDSLEIIIEDNGIGIGDDILDHVFNMFYIGTEFSQGNGLGLYIVNKCVSMLVGNIKIESTAGDYTKVIVSLPVDDTKGHALDFLNSPYSKTTV